MFKVHKIAQLLSLTALSAILISGCAKSPTGRYQLKLYPNSQLSQMGSQAFDGMKSEQKISSKKVTNAFVSCVAEYITKQVPKDVFDGEWEVVVFDEPQVNAFALPGGKIGVYTGLLDVAENQHQLAAVMGHEVGHVIAEHGNARMSNSALIGVTMEVANQVLKAKKVSHNKEIMSALGMGAQVGVLLPFSRGDETEADEIGLELMAKAGFKPEAAVKLWQNMDKANGGKRQPELLSTHPLPSSRIADLQAHMATAKALGSQATDSPNCQK